MPIRFFISYLEIEWTGWVDTEIISRCMNSFISDSLFQDFLAIKPDGKYRVGHWLFWGCMLNLEFVLSHAEVNLLLQPIIQILV